jgi:ABC-2 type transport system ATP-binding protein
LWQVVDQLTETGTTVVLTTQYLEEADRLADDIVVLDHGRVAAHGTPTELKRLVGGKVITATIPTGQLDRLPHVPEMQRPAGRQHVAVTYTVGDADAAGALVAHLGVVGITVHELEVISPSLDEVFAHLSPTGVRS